jgi:hypothetical protein
MELNYLPKAEDRVRIVYWLLTWAKEQGRIVWCDENVIRVSDASGRHMSKTMCWMQAAQIAAKQQFKSTGLMPSQRNSRGELPLKNNRKKEKE